MLQVSLDRLRQGHRTIAYPAGAAGACRTASAACPCWTSRSAPTAARPAPRLPDRRHHATASGPAAGPGRCLFCTDCIEACPEGAIRYTQDHRLATRNREDLVLEGQTLKLAQALEQKMRRLFGRSLKLRQVSAGGCNACEADLNVLGTVVFDLGRFGIQFVASPRHADGIVVTGAGQREHALGPADSLRGGPAPKLVIAVGACAISGGPYVDNPEVHNGCGSLLPVDLYVPGVPAPPADDPGWTFATPGSPRSRSCPLAPCCCSLRGADLLQGHRRPLCLP